MRRATSRKTSSQFGAVYFLSLPHLLKDYMQKHVKNYFEYFGYDKGDHIQCELCGHTAVDIHHVTYRSHGGSDEINNLVALCRGCHDWAHKNGKHAKTKLSHLIDER